MIQIFKKMNKILLRRNVNVRENGQAGLGCWVAGWKGKLGGDWWMNNCSWVKDKTCGLAVNNFYYLVWM